MMSHDAHEITQASALLVDGHWFPLMVRAHQGKIAFFTTSGGHDWALIAARQYFNEPVMITCQGSLIESGIPNDCGFQAVAWITSAVMDKEFCSEGFRTPPVSVKDAIVWRTLFEHALHSRGSDIATVVPANLSFGGVSGVDLSSQLQALLKDHGVPEDLCAHRATTVMDKLGRQAVARIFRAATPWKDLKAAANHATPKLQLVMESELQAAIAKRAEQGEPIGDKRRKLKGDKQAKRFIQLMPEDVGITEGIFKDAHQTNLTQIPLANIGPQAKGIVVCQAANAIPYLKLRKPISQHGLAMIVLDHRDMAIQGSGQEIRFPARCEKTGEAMLITARIIQLGAVEVSKIQAPQGAKVEEVTAEAIRIVAYKDELTSTTWDKFIARPIRHVIEAHPFLQTEGMHNPIIDIWDRQHLNERFEKTHPKQSSVFMACFVWRTSS